MEIQQVLVSKIKPWENNPRVNDQSIEAVAKSINAFGFNVPILCDQNFIIIAGHTRWKAAKKLALESVPVIVLQMTDTQRRAFNIADNKTAEIADWDFPKLRDVLKELRQENIDLIQIGYSEQELEVLLTPEEDLDWSIFEQQEAQNNISTNVFLPVKIQVHARPAIKKAIVDYAENYDIHEKDSAILAGLVLIRLLGLK